MIEDNSLWGIIFFLISMLVGIALVSVHYRKEYEQKKIENKRLKEIVYKYEEMKRE